MLNNKTIYLAGGCFWGVEKYLKLIPGVIATEVGYANGNGKEPNYEMVSMGDSGYAETVKVTYDSNQITLDLILRLFYEIIDPTSLNKQGNDSGTQYRTGVYYTDLDDKMVILKTLDIISKNYNEPILVEVFPLKNYFKAEEYHQQYLDKNPFGYCHIKTTKYSDIKHKLEEFKRESLDKMEIYVTKENGTEPPFNNKYNDNYRKGIYVDVNTGEPLFTSNDKFKSSCGWPSFSKPINNTSVLEKKDLSHGMHRTEIRSSSSDNHLGHVFEDGPIFKGGLRYCINSASLLFIPIEEMDNKGYGYLKDLIK